MNKKGLLEVPVRIQACTLGDWLVAYVASGEVAAEEHDDVRSLFRSLARLISDQPDPHQVLLVEARGLRSRYEQDLLRRQAEGTLAARSAKQYRSRLNKALAWARLHLGRLTPGFGVEVLDELDGPRWALIFCLEEQGVPREDRLGVQRLFRFMDQANHTLEDLVGRAEEVLAGFEADLSASGVAAKTWKETYRGALRGLRWLQEAGRLGSFPLRPHASWRHAPYGLPYAQFANRWLRQEVTTYARWASEAVEIGEARWTHRVVTPGHRDEMIKTLEEYVGFLEQCEPGSTAQLRVDALFSPARLEAYVAFVQENLGVAPNMVTSGIVTYVKRLRAWAHQYLGLPADPKGRGRFHLLYKNRKSVARRPVEKRLCSLVEWVALLQEMERQVAVLAEGAPRRCLQRLRVFCLVLLAVPVRPGCLQTLVLDQELVRDPATGVWWIRLPASRVKNRHPYEMPLPGFVAAELEEYLAEVRPNILQGRPSTYVFPSERGNGVATEVLLKELAALDFRVHGKSADCAVYLHSVRHTVVMTCARRWGQKALYWAGKLVGHSSVETTQRFYERLSRKVLDRDRQGETLMAKEHLTATDVGDLIQTLAYEPEELARFQQAFEKVPPPA